MAKTHHNSGSTDSLLTELLGGRNPNAWNSFLELYGPVMMSVAQQHTLDFHDAQDCFVHICEKLCEDDSRRLRKFDSARGGTFRGWLNAVASNLARDWCRAQYGRMGTPPAIRSLSVLEQMVFELCVARGLDRESCLIEIRSRLPETTRQELTQACSRVHAALSPQQRWKFGAFGQRGRIAPLSQKDASAQTSTAPGPLRQTTANEQRALLDAAMAQLTAQERLMLRLRYEQELTLEEVSVLAGLNNLHHARRVVQSALSKLSELLRDMEYP